MGRAWHNCQSSWYLKWHLLRYDNRIQCAIEHGPRNHSQKSGFRLPWHIWQHLVKVEGLGFVYVEDLCAQARACVCAHVHARTHACGAACLPKWKTRSVLAVIRKAFSSAATLRTLRYTRAYDLLTFDILTQTHNDNFWSTSKSSWIRCLSPASESNCPECGHARCVSIIISWPGS